MLSSVDVFIVGAGPTGLFMAAELLRWGLTCRVIDKSSQPSDKSKAIGVQARTLEIFHHIGLVDACLAQGVKIYHFLPMSHHKKLADISLKLIDSPFPFLLSLEQNRLEAIFIQHLEKLGCRVERQTELINYEEKDQRVIVTLHHQTGKTELSEARWLIGCDGAHSTVRKLMRLEFEGLSFPQIFSLADIEIEWKYPRDSIMAFLNKTGILAAIPLHEKNRIRLIFQLERAKEFLKTNQGLSHGEISSHTLQTPTLEEISQIVHEYADSEAVIRNPVWMANFSINSRMVNHYQKNNIFLIGDAAHIHSPIAGQGMNTGLQDAFNLGWKLALVHKGIAKTSILTSYQDERHYIGKKLLRGTERATSFILMRASFLSYLKNKLISFFASFTYFQKKIVSLISEVGLAYPLSAWIMQKKSRYLKLKAGMRAPDASVIHLELQSSLFNVWKNTSCFQLLLINDYLSDLDNHTSKAIEQKYQGLIKVYFIGSFRKNNDQKDHLKDVKQEIKARYGESTVYLIRPDGYIGYCGPFLLEPLEAYLNHLLV